ncbi:MAG TPA: LysR substrate-binding domain-containing protein [Terriglobales bacterium]|nr:LysR substrate-binding domain-containing protein [Terriglobales bacterium]
MNATVTNRERSLELSDLALFKTVAEAGSITKAGARVHRVPSNLTARVKRLEGQLGVSLFVRGRRGMSLTPEGRRLMDYADRLLSLADEAHADLSAQPARGRLVIGSMESTAAVHLPALLSTLHAKYPALDVELRTGTSGALVAQVRAGELSAAFVAGEITDPGLAIDPAFDEELVLVTHPSLRRPGAAELRGRTLVTFGAGCAYRGCIERWLGERGVRPPRTFDVASYHLMLACVAAGVGYALAPRSVLLASTARANVRAHRLMDRPWRITTSLVRRASDHSRAVDALRALVAARRRR